MLNLRSDAACLWHSQTGLDECDADLMENVRFFCQVVDKPGWQHQA
jgi:hypothetical protein